MIPRIETAITLPFSIDGLGNIGKTYDQNKIWGDRVRSVIGTLKSERVMRKEFGSTVALNSFQGFDIAKEALVRSITEAFVAYLPQLTLVSVDVFIEEETDTVMVEVIYNLPSTSTNAIMQVGVASISGNNIIQEAQL